jgi:hypothetical protein
MKYYSIIFYCRLVLSRIVQLSQRLRQNPRIPAIPQKIPRSCVELLQGHESLGLHWLVNASKGHWPAPVRLAFSRRQYLYNTIVERARLLQGDEFENKKKRAAERLDNERHGKTIPTFLSYLKENDGRTRRRNKN